MQTERSESMSAGRAAAAKTILGSAIVLALLFTLGVMGRNASSSQPVRKAVAASSARGERAPDVTAQADPGDREQRLAGHSELILQLD